MPHSPISLRIACLAPLLALLALSGCTPPIAAPEAGRPPRIISLAPSLTEILFAIGAGDCVVGRTDVCNYPPEAADVPVVGGFGKPAIDTLAAQKPTHIFNVDLEDESQPALFKRLGWASERIPCHRLDDIPEAVLILGRHTGRTNEAARLASDISEGIAARRAAVARTEALPSVLVVIWWEPLMTVGKPSFIADLVTLAGGRLVTEGIDRDYFTVSEEWALRQNPDVILCLTMTPAGETTRRLQAATGWRAVKAVREGRLYEGFDNDIVCRPGPRVLAAADQFHAALNGETPAITP